MKNSRYRRIVISDELERLHSEYVWQLCDAGAHQVLDLENHFMFVNLLRGRGRRRCARKPSMTWPPR